MPQEPTTTTVAKPVNAVRLFVPAPILPKTTSELLALANVFYLGGMTKLSRPEAAAAVMAFGMEIGIPPAMALNCIHLTNGKATLWGDVPLAMVQGSGLLKMRKEWIDGSGESRTAHCTIERENDPEGPVTFHYSVADARKMGLFMKGGKEGPWDKDTDWMLTLRSRGRGLRSKFADVLNGMTIGEADDSIEQPPAQVEVTVRPEPQAAAQPAISNAPLVSSAPPTIDQPIVVQGEVMVDDAQVKEIVRLQSIWIKVAGPTGATVQDGIAAWKAMLKESYGVESAKKLTEAQGNLLITKLKEIEKHPTAGLVAA